ncbi:MAG: hypothetical protein ORN49_05520, partial [Rhodobacteraceae bacterium]|nr:hypothetical protein [Paracoccaceae bacterium]
PAAGCSDNGQTRRLAVARCNEAMAARFQCDAGEIELTEEDIDFLRRAFAALPTGAQVRRVQCRAAEPQLRSAEVAQASPETDSQDPRPAQTGKRWYPEDDARLAQALADGRTVPDIAEEFARSPGSIFSRALLKGLITVIVAGGAQVQAA